MRLKKLFNRIIGRPSPDEIKNFIESARENNFEKVESFLSRYGRYIDAMPEKTLIADENALMAAAEKGNALMAALLLEKGANVNARNEFGRTPLIAARGAETALLLISKGAEIDASDDVGRTALISAVFNHEKGKMIVLLENGACPEQSFRWNPKTNMDHEGGEGYTPLMIAASQGDADSLAILMRFNAKLSRNHKGQTAFDIVRGLRQSVYFKSDNYWRRTECREDCRTQEHDACQKMLEQYNLQKSRSAPHEGLGAGIAPLSRLKVGKRPS